MKTVTAAASAAIALFAFAGAAHAKGPEVEIRDAVARVVVIPEDRTDIAVEVVRGSNAELPAITIERTGSGKVRIHGNLKRRIRGCDSRSDGAAPAAGSPLDSLSGVTVRVRGIGEVQMSAAPVITIRTPKAVNVDAGGAVFGWVGRADSVDLGNAGCGDWVVADSTGAVHLSQAGSGDTRAGRSSSLSISVAGSGDIQAGSTGNLEASIAGSGDVVVASVRGSVEASIAGSGNVTVNGGAVTSVDASIAGSGDIDIKTSAQSVDASIMGSGDINVRSVSGKVDKSVMGSGSINVGG